MLAPDSICSPQSPHVSACWVVAWLVALSQPLAGQQFAELGKRHLPVVRNASTTVAAGDVDGDGDVDLIVGNNPAPSLSSGRTRLKLNRGDGVFTDATEGRIPAIEERTNDVDLVDIDGDGDGDLDLLVSNETTVRLYRNDGTGTFDDRTGTDWPMDGQGATDLVCLDVDGDGDEDAVCASPNRLYLNDGSGAFVEAVGRLATLPGSARSLAAVDVDADGDLDLVWGMSSFDILHLNDGTGRFTEAPAGNFSLRAGQTSAIAAGDIDGDGDQDLVFGKTRARLQIAINDGQGLFTDETFARLNAPERWTTSLLLVDLDGDGDLDLYAASDLAETDTLFENRGNGIFDRIATGFPQEEQSTADSVAADVDADGDLDIVRARGADRPTSGRNTLYFNTGSLSFADATAPRLPDAPAESLDAEIGDVDLDGDTDVVVAQPDGPVVATNDGDGRFGLRRIPGTFVRVVDVALGDLDGDGDLDLAVADASGEPRIFINQGSGDFVDASTSLPGILPRTEVVQIGDLNGDGDADLVFAGWTFLAVYRNAGNGFVFEAFRVPPLTVTEFNDVTLFDVDRDGDLDILGATFRQSLLLENDGVGVFRDATTRLPSSNANVYEIVPGDVDGDGDVDLVLASRPGGNRLYLNDGTGRFADVTAGRIPAGFDLSESLELVDFDGDGDLDAVSGVRVVGSLQVPLGLRAARNDGSGRFTLASAAMPEVLGVDPVGCIRAADFDRDGDQDLFVCNSGPDRVLLNRSQHVTVPFSTRAPGELRLEFHAVSPRAATVVSLPFLSTDRVRVRLGNLGTFRLDPTRLLPLPLTAFASSAPGQLVVAVPADAGLVGLTASVQALLIEQPGPSRLTNVDAETVIR